MRVLNIAIDLSWAQFETVYYSM